MNVNNDLPLNIKIDNAKDKLDKCLGSLIMEYGLPAFIMSGILAEILIDVKNQERKELINSYKNIINNESEEMNEE